MVEARNEHAPPTDAIPVYGTLVQLAIHGQENKWWMLYVFLMFNSILVLSCAALFSVQRFGAAHSVLLYVLSLVGALIDTCWIFMATDYVKAANLYSDEAVLAEKLLPEGLPRPLTKRQEQRAGKCSLGTSKFIAIAFPVLLICLYGLIAVMTCLHQEAR